MHILSPRLLLRSHAPLFLVGMPGAGKSCVARAASSRFNVRWIDTDDSLRASRRGGGGRASGRAASLSDIGPTLEARHVQDLFRSALLPPLVATGGSVACVPESREAMRARDGGLVVWLRPPVETLERRLGSDPAAWEARGVFMGAHASIRALAEAREPHYAACADVVLASVDLAETVGAVGALLGMEAFGGWGLSPPLLE